MGDPCAGEVPINGALDAILQLTTAALAPIPARQQALIACGWEAHVDGISSTAG